MKKVLLPILTMAILFVGCSKAVESQDEYTTPQKSDQLLSQEVYYIYI